MPPQPPPAPETTPTFNEQPHTYKVLIVPFTLIVSTIVVAAGVYVWSKNFIEPVVTTQNSVTSDNDYYLILDVINCSPCPLIGVDLERREAAKAILASKIPAVSSEMGFPGINLTVSGPRFVVLNKSNEQRGSTYYIIDLLEKKVTDQFSSFDRMYSSKKAYLTVDDSASGNRLSMYRFGTATRVLVPNSTLESPLTYVSTQFEFSFMYGKPIATTTDTITVGVYDGAQGTIFESPEYRVEHKKVAEKTFSFPN